MSNTPQGEHPNAFGSWNFLKRKWSKRCKTKVPQELHLSSNTATSHGHGDFVAVSFPVSVPGRQTHFWTDSPCEIPFHAWKFPALRKEIYCRVRSKAQTELLERMKVFYPPWDALLMRRLLYRWWTLEKKGAAAKRKQRCCYGTLGNPVAQQRPTVI